jgi:hypothetical protein
MDDNIRMVAEHLSEMIDVYEASDIDYALGLVTFRVPFKKNTIEIWQITKDWKRYRSILYGLSAEGDEAENQRSASLRLSEANMPMTLFTRQSPKFTSDRNPKSILSSRPMNHLPALSG